FGKVSFRSHIVISQNALFYKLLYSHHQDPKETPLGEQKCQISLSAQQRQELLSGPLAKPTLSKSETEAEYRPIAVAETLWVRSLLVDLGLVLRRPVQLLCDN
ncbi:hypothetical protein, partial [Clostridioides difficile]|uniref:hypothetical protein n=1 Tax=Clostridioides difficile TaxID=1496 RepID=UPI002114929C